MAEVFNVYCDESCHLENDRITVMVLGAVWCKATESKAIATRVREIKSRRGLAPEFEIKWTKVSPGKQQFYLDLVDYFFDDDDLHFRGVLIPDKTLLVHGRWNQTHDDWYYKMCFRMLEPIIDPKQVYDIYLDIKDTRSEQKRAKLEEVLRNSRYDRSGEIIRKVQQIRSHESNLIQMADLLIGAVAYHNRRLQNNAAKLAVIRRIRQRSGKVLDQSTWLREPKFNLFRWLAQGGAM